MNKKIVLIEDEEDIRATTSEILELADYKVYSAENGLKGVKLVKDKNPDLVICDIMMPTLDGYGVLNILSKDPETSQIPFIFLTAKAENSDIRKGMNLGADDYITKPFDETALLERVEMRLKKSELMKKEFKHDINGLNEFIDTARGINELQDLSKNRKIKKYEKKEVIYHEDDYANYLFFIIKGKVKCIKTDLYGKDFMNDLYGAGEFIGYMTLFNQGEYHETATAMEPTEVAVIPRQDFLTLINKNRDVAATFIKMLANNVQEKEKRLLQIAYAPVRERLAEAILKLDEKGYFQNENTNQMEISRFDLASIIGTAKESLIRTLSELKREGLVDTDGQEIRILDKVGLKKAAAG